MNLAITRLKALGILAVLLYHSGCGGMFPYSQNFLGMIRMPLFFILAGFCMKPTGLLATKTFFSKKIKGLYWPYVKWGILFLLLHNIFTYLYFLTDIYSTKNIVAHAYYIVAHMLETEQLLGGYWFLPALLTGYVMAWLLLRFLKRIEIGLLLSLIIGVLMNVCSSFFSLEGTVASYIPFSIILVSARSFEVAFYIIVGYWFAQKKIKPFNNWQIIASLSITFIGSLYWKINTGELFFENEKYIPFLLTSVLATWSLYSLLVRFNDKNGRIATIIDFVGNNTLTFLTWHFLVFRLVSVLIMAVYKLPNNVLSEHPVIHEYSAKGWWLVYFAVAVLVCYGISCINKRITNSWLKL